MITVRNHVTHHYYGDIDCDGKILNKAPRTEGYFSLDKLPLNKENGITPMELKKINPGAEVRFHHIIFFHLSYWYSSCKLFVL